VMKRLMMKKQMLTWLGAAGLSVATGMASAEVAVGAGLASDYMWRGVTQNDRDVAVSGSLDYSHENGFFVGAWASMTEFGGEDGYELDLYFGYAGSINEELEYSVTINRYAYPDYEDSDFTEVWLDFSYSHFSAGVAYTFDSEVDEPGVFVEEDLYYYGSVAFDLSNDFSLTATVGYYDFADDGNAAVGDVSYAHYQLDLSKSFGDFGDVTASLYQADDESGDDNALITLSWNKSFSL